MVFQVLRCYREVGRRRTLLTILCGMFPLLAWECFSIVYYGAFVPNTALAKLPLGYPRADLIHKGLTLIQATAIKDPGTLCSIIVLPIALLLVRSRLWLPSMFASAASLAYVIWVGGDFMLGRFLSFAFVFSWLCLLAGMGRRDNPEGVSGDSLARRGTIAFLFVAVAALSALGLIGQLQRNKFSVDYGPQPLFKAQIADERSYYNLITNSRAIFASYTPPWVVEGELFKRRLAGRKALVAKRNIGMFGYGAGPDVFILDVLSLGDPFLSRLPSCLAGRPGHFEHPMPTGYVESLATGRNTMGDPVLAQLLDDTTLATRAPLGTPGRLAAIWRLNTGAYRDPQRIGAYIRTPAGVQVIGAVPGNEFVPCTPVTNGAGTDILVVTDYGVQSPPWNVPVLRH